MLPCRPVEAEAKLSFSALADLFEVVPDRVIASLPEPQRRALDVALLRLAASAPLDARAVGAALLSTITEHAQSSPVVIAIDDTQWLDTASSNAVEFALRRIRSDRVGLLASRRPDARRGARVFGSALPNVQVIELGPLSLGAIRATRFAYSSPSK